MSPFRLRLARDLLRAGAVLAYATEGVFGIGCDPRRAGAVERIVALKGRPAHKGLILVAADVAQALEFAAPLDRDRMAPVLASWPGPVTWVLPARAHVHPLVTGHRATVAVRVTDHPGTAALCRAFGRALVSTSANESGRRPARTRIAALRALRGRVDAVLPGRVGGRGGPSEIRDARSGRVLRPGSAS